MQKYKIELSFMPLNSNKINQINKSFKIFHKTLYDPNFFVKLLKILFEMVKMFHIEISII